MAASEAPAYSPLVRAGDTVIFDINGDRQAILTLDGRRWAHRAQRGATLKWAALLGALPALHSTARGSASLSGPVAAACSAHRCLTPPSACRCSKVKLGKTSCSAAPLIGCPYGSMFALAADGKSLERTT
jgi:hypothetical protein